MKPEKRINLDMFSIIKLDLKFQKCISFRMSRQGSIPGRPSIPDPSEDQIRTHACELIELVRNQSGLSYNLAQDTIHSVLTYISTNFTRLDRNVPGLYYFFHLM